jgi:hypothetical protein
MHESWSWHPAYWLPFVTYHVVPLDRVQWNIVEPSKHIDLLRLKYRNS